MTEQTLFNQYLSGSITHAQYIGNLKQINEKHIQDQSSKHYRKKYNWNYPTTMWVGNNRAEDQFYLKEKLKKLKKMKK